MRSRHDENHEARHEGPRRSVTEMASVTLHIPLSTLRAFQQKAITLQRSESELAREAFERILGR